MLAFELIRPGNPAPLFINALADENHDAVFINANEVIIGGDRAIGLNVLDEQSPGLAVVRELPHIGLEVMFKDVLGDNLHVEPFSFGLFRYDYYDRLCRRCEAAPQVFHN